ncbi:hypothetical protein OAP83_01910 [Rickettsiales bacterium]|nr:hypothetical protein [Rickettsiales bacterium]
MAGNFKQNSTPLSSFDLQEILPPKAFITLLQNGNPKPVPPLFIEKQLAKVKTEQELHDGADGGFKDEVVTAFNLASKASELFESSKTTEKRELIAFVFSNLSLRGVELEYTLRKPFDMMVNLTDRASWLSV